MAKLSFKNINKVYPSTVAAVKDFNLEIDDQEFIVLVGPSGCGKSTVLRMVAGLESITGGELYIDGQLMNKVPPKKRDIAMVFQNYALYPHMNVYKNMSFGLKLRRIPKADIDKRVREAAEMLGIADLLKRKPRELSGGQRQRVALGRALVREPRVFLMDEPLSNLDAKLRVQMRAEITKLHKKLKTTFIYVTHDQTEAMTMGTRIVVMHEGVIQQVDTPRNLFDRPANLFVATFIGTPQMNTIKARLTPRDGKMYAVFGNNALRIPDLTVKKLKSDIYIGKDIYVGIRPEDITDDAEEIAGRYGCELECSVEMTELMGSETYLYLTADGVEGSIVARVSPRSRTAAGETVKIAADPSRLYLFDAKTGENILFYE